MRFLDLDDVLRCSCGDDHAPAIASLWPQIDDPIRCLDDIEVVLDDDGRVAGLHQPMENIKELVNIRGMEPGGRFIEDIERFPCRASGEFFGQLDALRLSPRELGGRLAERDVGQSHVMQRLKSAFDARDVLEEGQGFFNGHGKDIGDRLALVVDLESVSVLARALAHFARNVDIGKKVHLDLFLPLTLAGFATSALDIEAESAGCIRPQPGVRRLGEQRTDVVENLGVGGGVGSRRSPDGRLVDLDNLVDMLDAGDLLVSASAPSGQMELVRDPAIENVLDQRALAGARHAGDTDESSERELHIDVSEIVLGCSEDLQLVAIPLTPGLTANRPPA